MKRTWQFNLAALFGVTTVATLPLLMVTTNDPVIKFWGYALAVPTFGGCLGFLIGGWGGVWPGIAIAVMLGLAATLLLAF